MIMEQYREKLLHIIIDLIENKDVIQFYSGFRGDFDLYCSSLIYELKDRYPHIKNTMVKDKNNMGVFGDEMHPYLKTDKQLHNAIDNGRLTLDNNNWIEYDGEIKAGNTDSAGVFIDLGIVCDNILDDDILQAIEQALDSIEEIKKEIVDVAETHYGINVGAV